MKTNDRKQNTEGVVKRSVSLPSALFNAASEYLESEKERTKVETSFSRYIQNLIAEDVGKNASFSSSHQKEKKELNGDGFLSVSQSPKKSDMPERQQKKPAKP